VNAVIVLCKNRLRNNVCGNYRCVQVLKRDTSVTQVLVRAFLTSFHRHEFLLTLAVGISSYADVARRAGEIKVSQSNKEHVRVIKKM
jgi:hypothetical protein